MWFKKVKREREGKTLNEKSGLKSTNLKKQGRSAAPNNPNPALVGLIVHGTISLALKYPQTHRGKLDTFGWRFNARKSKPGKGDAQSLLKTQSRVEGNRETKPDQTKERT